MKIFLPLLLLFLMSGCAAEKLNIDSAEVTQITITVLPKDNSLKRVYTDRNKTKAVSSYLNSLNLISHFTENVDEYDGQTYIITLDTDHDESTIIYHFGNVFIKQDENEWKKISYKQGSELYSLILKYESDE